MLSRQPDRGDGAGGRGAACFYPPLPCAEAVRLELLTLDQVLPDRAADRLTGIPAFDSTDRTSAAAERAALEAGNRGAPVGRSRGGAT